MTWIGCGPEDYEAYLEAVYCPIKASSSARSFYIVMPDTYGLTLQDPSEYADFVCDNPNNYHLQVFKHLPFLRSG